MVDGFAARLAAHVNILRARACEDDARAYARSGHTDTACALMDDAQTYRIRAAVILWDDTPPEHVV